MQDNAPLLRVEKLTKKFGEVTANDEVSFEIMPGEIHCFLGENGAGKSTLAECLYGYFTPNSGEIFIDGKKVHISSPRDAIRLGIGMVHQHFVLVRPISVIENIVVGTPAAHFLLDLSNASRTLDALCAEYDVKIDLSAKVWQLCVGEQQWVEIMKALFGGVRLLILDEPTAVLTPQESERLFAILRKMKQNGLSVILITHKLNEVLEVSDKVTVLRRGRKIATVKTSEVTREDLARMMVGREVVFRVEKPHLETGDIVLEVENLQASNDRGQPALDGVSFEVRSGEVVGIAGVSGNGQKELFETVIGVRPPVGGKVRLSDVDITRHSIQEIAARGIAHIPEDRLKEGIVPDFSISENLMLGPHKTRFYKFGGGFEDRQDLENFAGECIHDFDIVTPSSKQATRNLSGGNIQKVILARELSGRPACLIASHPTRGLDVGAIEYVHNRLLRQCAEGTGILLISDDLDELLNLSDRILVMFKGNIVGELDAKTATREEIGMLMAGCWSTEQ